MCSIYGCFTLYCSVSVLRIYVLVCPKFLVVGLRQHLDRQKWMACFSVTRYVWSIFSFCFSVISRWSCIGHALHQVNVCLWFWCSFSGILNRNRIMTLTVTFRDHFLCLSVWFFFFYIFFSWCIIVHIYLVSVPSLSVDEKLELVCSRVKIIGIIM